MYLMVIQRSPRGNVESVETTGTIDASVNIRPTLPNLLTHSASGPSLCSASSHRHTISSAYSRSLSRPQVTAHTFESPYGFGKAQAGSSIYATPTNVQRQTADIYARPTLCGRRFSQGAVAVAPPVVPPEYATIQKQVARTGTSSHVQSAVCDRKQEMTDAQLQRSSSLPSPVYSDVCDITDCGFKTCANYSILCVFQPVFVKFHLLSLLSRVIIVNC